MIGLGVGRQHALAYHIHADTEVRAICDLDENLLRSVGEELDITERHVDYRKITEHPDIDVVSICSYDNFHAEQTISALNNDKHVIVEKPAVLHRHESVAVIEALQKSGKIITSNLILRASPRFIEIKRQVDAGAFGDIFHIEGDYLHDILWKITQGWRGKMDFYCTFYGGGVHLVDLMRWIMGQEVTRVCAMGSDVLTRKSKYRWPDTITALMNFEGGATGKCTTSMGPQRTKFHSLNVFGTEQTFVNDMPDGKIFTSDDPTDEVAMTTPYPAVEKGDLLPDFINAIQEGRKPLVNETDIFRVMDVCLAVRDAMETGRAVEVNYLL